MSEIRQCCAKVVRSGEFHAGRCRRTASIEFEGKWFCRTHYPPNVEKRNEEWEAKFDAEMERKRKERKRAEENTLIAEYVRREYPDIASEALR